MPNAVYVAEGTARRAPTSKRLSRQVVGHVADDVIKAHFSTLTSGCIKAESLRIINTNPDTGLYGAHHESENSYFYHDLKVN